MIGKQLLFVCLGNICRSPAAEAVMRDKLKERGLNRQIICDSAGILGYHSGKQADHRMRRYALNRGYEVTSISRQVKAATDFDRFDMIIGMDDQNIRDLIKLARSEEDRKIIFKMTDFCSRHDFKDVPDPYCGEQEEFELVLDLLEDACDGLIEHLNKQIGKKGI
jgi:protein-tyrosine phosphatase